MKNHQQQTIDQFTKQAACFSEAPEIKDEAALQLVIQFAGLKSDDDVLDVACGPGILACACAKIVERVTGIDITPAMIERAKDLQAPTNWKTWRGMSAMSGRSLSPTIALALSCRDTRFTTSWTRLRCLSK